MVKVSKSAVLTHVCKLSSALRAVGEEIHVYYTITREGNQWIRLLPNPESRISEATRNSLRS
jgi:hypothetical protein